MRGIRIGAALCGVALLLGACGGSSKNSTGGTPGTSGAAGASTSTSGGSSGSGGSIASDAACKFITQSDATTLFGNPATQIPDSSPSQAAKSVCLWSSKPTDRISYLLQVRMYASPAFYSGNVTGYSPVSGIGDRAVMTVLPGGSTIMLSSQSGDNVIAVSYSVHDLSGSGARRTAEAQKDQFVALVRSASGR